MSVRPEQILTPVQLAAYLAEQERLNKKYADFIDDSQFREADTPASFRERLKRLYPQPYQHSYIDGVWNLAIAGSIGILTAYHIALGKTLPSSTTEYFDPEMNSHLQGKSLIGDDRESLLIVMNPNKKVDCIRSFNLAKFNLKARTEAAKRELFQAVAEISPDSQRFQLEMLDEQIKFLIQHGRWPFNIEILSPTQKEHLHSLAFEAALLEQSAGAFQRSAEVVGERYDPVEIASHSLMVSYISDYVDIWPSVTHHIQQAVALELGFPELKSTGETS